MKYTTLFNNKNKIHIGVNLHCVIGNATDVTNLLCQNHYPILFVLQGELDVRFRTHSKLIRQGHFAVIASADLTGYSLSLASVVLIFYPSERFVRYLDMSSKTFKLSISEILPIQPLLREWIDERLKHYVAGDESVQNNNEISHEKIRCSELVRILISYPRDSINTLYIPLYACSIDDCKNCTM